jgi:hypothetical protein
VRQYYYTVSSLPAIRFEEVPFLDADEFLEICRIETSPDDQALIEAARILPEADDEEGEKDDERDGLRFAGVLGDWNRTISDFRFHAAQIRAQNLGWDAERIPRPLGLDASMGERCRAILNEDTPLKMEHALMRWLWQLADDLESGHHFDREKLVVYHLKLQLAARRARLADSEGGGEEFDRQYEEVAHALMEIAT